LRPGSCTNAPVGVERFAVQTRDPELAHELLSEIYGVHRALLSGRRADFRFSLSSASVGSHIDFGSVAKLAAATTDSDPATFRFLGMRPVSPAMGQYWRTLMVYLDRELAAAQPAIGQPLVLAQTEVMLAAAALAVFPNTSVASGSRARFGRASAGVGARALQLSFAGHYGSTPMGYLRRVRLDRAHCELQAADPARGDTVGQVARRWGFAKRSRFAASYRRAYGVSPSHTLRT
jgi:hypothetical protein